jgi:HEAT repeat protein
VLAFITSACTGSGGEDSRVRAAREAERAIAGAEEQGAPATELAIDRLAVGSPDELRAAALAHIEDASPEVHSAALYALALSVNQDDRKAIDALRGFLDPGADDERLTAADGLLSIGEKAAIPVLIELLTSKAPVPDSDPPTAVWEVAKGLLLFHTDQDLGLGEAEVAGAAAAAQVDWEAWWEASAEDLTWDPDTWSFTS